MKFLISILCFSIYYLSADAIKNGDNVAITYYPYVAQVLLPSSEVCAGAILSEKYILTTADCLPQENLDELLKIRIRVGASTVNLESKDDLLDIAGTITQGSGPLGLVELAEPLQFNERVQSIQFSQDVPSVKSKVMVLGFGDRFKKAHGLKKAEVQVLKTEPFEVQSVFQCNGDEGGPVVYNNKLVGVAVKGCGKTAGQSVLKIDPQFINTEIEKA